MTVAAILRHKGFQVTAVEPTVRIAEVVRILAERRTGAVLVLDRAEQLLGLVSDREIMASLAANGDRTLDMTAGQLMTRALHVVHPDTSISEALSLMIAWRLRHLPVMEEGVAVGLVSVGDLVKARMMRQQALQS